MKSNRLHNLPPLYTKKATTTSIPLPQNLLGPFDVTAIAFGARVAKHVHRCRTGSATNGYVKIGLGALRGGIRSFATEQSLATPSSSTSSRTNPKLTRKVRALTLEA